eukprot:2220406-Amphidinium_carterae.4
MVTDWAMICWKTTRNNVFGRHSDTVGVPRPVATSKIRHQFVLLSQQVLRVTCIKIYIRTTRNVRVFGQRLSLKTSCGYQELKRLGAEQTVFVSWVILFLQDLGLKYRKFMLCTVTPVLPLVAGVAWFSQILYAGKTVSPAKCSVG